MKWAFLSVSILSLAPLTAWLRQDSRRTPAIWMGIGVLVYFLDLLHLYMAVVSWAYWPGFVKGVELTVLDLICISIFFSLPRSSAALPFRMTGIAYLAAVVISAFQAGVPEATFFYAWQLIRMFFVFAVTARACAQNERVAPALLKGMAIGICAEFCLCVWQRFGLGAIQPHGTFEHQNTLGMAINLSAFPFFALWLAGKRGWEPVVGAVAAALVAIMTASRATIGLGAAGFALTFLISAVHRWTFRKTMFALASLALLVVLVPAAVAVLNSRFAVNPLSDVYDERAAFETAALAILQDHPMGVGANNYVVAANTQGYNDRAGVEPSTGSLSAHVHNVYLVVASETGYIGLITFVLLLVQPLLVAFSWGWRLRDNGEGDLLLGLGVSLLIFYIHSLFEWVFLTYHLQYFVALECGMISGLVHRVRSRGAIQRNSLLYGRKKEVEAVNQIKV